MSDDLIAEFGSSDPIRFLDASCVTMHDGDGNVMLCACGKPAGGAVIGLEAYKCWCFDCSPFPKYEAKITYRPPNAKEN